ncbi:MAG: DUF1588 domain-containing protein [Verrucomicrobiales bacterium]|nr:DUF1588 domain-containing protein [Verrucomicrobiales bacterium]
MKLRFLTFVCSLSTLAGSWVSAEEIPAPIQKIISNSCLECHDADSEKGDVNLDSATIDWKNIQDLDIWQRALNAIDEGTMPPPDEAQPTEEERNSLFAFLDENLLEHTPIGGTLPRRLNKAEYEATIRDLVQLSKFKLPLGFPKDTEYHGFDNVGEGLVLSPPHLNAYTEVAREIADQIFPPERAAPKIQKWEAGPEDMVLSFSAATVHGDALRLVSRSVDIMRSCTWPSRIEIGDSGTYQMSVSASKFLADTGHPFEEPMLLAVYARPVSATDRSTIRSFRLLKEISVKTESPEVTTFEADLYKGETLLFHWANAEMTHAHAELSAQFEEWFKTDPRFLAAWQKAVFRAGDIRNPQTTSLRGRNGWDIVSKHWADPDLDLSEATMDSKMTKRFLQIADSNNGTFNLADALCHFYHNNGPALEFHHLTVEGPSKLVESPADKARENIRQRITGVRKEGQSQEDFAREMLKSFLPRAFRRPVSDETIASYLTIATRHWDEGHSLDEGLHLLLRNILISPRFLYRSLGPEKMDDFDLATRLSYFLAQRPPDATLRDLAERNRLSPTIPAGPNGERKEYWVLRREAERLLPTRETAPFIQSFVGQWLDTETLSGIMPDPKFRFEEDSTRLAKRETERFFLEILAKNLPMTDFIDPDFTFTSVNFAARNYGFTPRIAKAGGNKLDTKAKAEFQRIGMKRGGRYGGLLGQAAILMATANGVDTQPVIRGVWVLENILGTPPPPPPKNVPALTPDTQGATTPRELLSAHTREAACAGCHQRIDPVGYVLENYDPVGRWRTEWPVSNAKIDPSGTLPDGTEIKDAIEFKSWLVENIDLFSQCLAEKLMIYATGRVPNYAETREIEEIVKRNHETGNGFRDLLLSLIESETFRTK